MAHGGVLVGRYHTAFVKLLMALGSGAHLPIRNSFHILAHFMFMGGIILLLGYRLFGAVECFTCAFGQGSGR